MYLSHTHTLRMGDRVGSVGGTNSNNHRLIGIGMEDGLGEMSSAAAAMQYPSSSSSRPSLSAGSAKPMTGAQMERLVS